MAIRQRKKERQRLLPGAVATGLRRLVFGTYGFFIVAMACAAWASLATWSVHDPSLNNATRAAPRNALGDWGAIIADLSFQSLGLASIFFFLPLAAWGWHLVSGTGLDRRRARLLAWPAAVIVLAAALSAVPQPKSWPLPNGLGGIMGDFVMAAAHIIGPFLPEAAVAFVAGLAFFVLGTMLLLFACGSSVSSLIALWAPRHKIASEWANASLGAAMHAAMSTSTRVKRVFGHGGGGDLFLNAGVDAAIADEDWRASEPDPDGRIEPSFGVARADYDYEDEYEDDDEDDDDITTPDYRITRGKGTKKGHHTTWHGSRLEAPYDAPSTRLLQRARSSRGRAISDEVLQENARELEGVFQDFGVKGEITNVHPGPVVTLY